MALKCLGYRTTNLMITAKSLKVRNIAFKIKDEISCSDAPAEVSYLVEQGTVLVVLLVKVDQH